jgi:[acyl-carrier-protein] S-malonyltransferase
MRPQDVKFSGEKPKVPPKKAPSTRKPITASQRHVDRPEAKTVTKVAEGAEVEKPKSLPTPMPVAKSVLMFPGQGSQYVKMLSELKDHAAVKAYCETAREILGYDILELCLSGPEKDLEDTSKCQPAMFLAGMAGLEKLKSIKAEALENPGCVAGLSLGEYTALCAAGVFTFEQGLKLVKVRAEAMSEAAKSCPQAMLSVAGLDRNTLERICQEHTQGEELAVIANVLFPKGFACSGTKGAIEKMQEACIKAGAMQAKVLKTSGAFHSSFMQPASDKLEEALEKLLPEMRPPRCDIYMNFTGKRLKAGSPPEEIVPLLSKQLTSPVLWEPSVRCMIDDGMNEFFEIGPMKQLKAMMKRIEPKMWEKTTNIDV